MPGSGHTNATGTITTTQSAPVSMQGASSCSIQLVGTWTGTIVFEATVDGTDWVAVPMNPIGGGAAVTSATANGIWSSASLGGITQVRARGNSVATGAASVYLVASAG